MFKPFFFENNGKSYVLNTDKILYVELVEYPAELKSGATKFVVYIIFSGDSEVNIMFTERDHAENLLKYLVAEG